MTEMDKLKDLAKNVGENTVLDALGQAILETIHLTIPRPTEGFAVISAVYCSMLNTLMRDCLKPSTEADVISALHDTTEQVRELIAELTALAPELAKLAKERE